MSLIVYALSVTWWEHQLGGLSRNSLRAMRFARGVLGIRVDNGSSRVSAGYLLVFNKVCLFPVSSDQL